MARKCKGCEQYKEVMPDWWECVIGGCQENRAICQGCDYCKEDCTIGEVPYDGECEDRSQMAGSVWLTQEQHAALQADAALGRMVRAMASARRTPEYPNEHTSIELISTESGWFVAHSSRSWLLDGGYATPEEALREAKHGEEG